MLFFQLIQEFYNVTYTNRNDGEPVSDYTITFLWSLTNALYLPGGMIGAYAAGFLADKVGRLVIQIHHQLPLVCRLLTYNRVNISRYIINMLLSFIENEQCS